MSRTDSQTPAWLRQLRLAGIVVPVVAILIFHSVQMARDGGTDLMIGILSVLAVITFGVTMFVLLGHGYRIIEHQNRELAGTNAILTAVARHDPHPAIMDQVRAHIVALLAADDANITLAPGHFSTVSTSVSRSQPSSATQVGTAPVVLRGATIGEIHVHREKELLDREQRLLETAADMISLTVAQVGVVENERHRARVDELDRIARELHDSLAQVLGTLHLRLRAIPEPIESHAVQIRDEVNALGDLCHSAYQDVREAITGLRSLTRSEESFTQAVTTYASHYSRLGGPDAVLDFGATELDLDPASRLHLLRILQEALTNTRKHARADTVRITLRDTAEGHHLLVEDDGQGFEATLRSESRVGFGLDTMRERSTLIGATFDVQSAPGAGTRVSIHLPQRGEGLRHMGGTAR